MSSSYFRQNDQRSVVKVSEKRPNREKYAERDMLSNDGTRQDTKTRRKTIQKRWGKCEIKNPWQIVGTGRKINFEKIDERYKA